jgi:hypothetical protein
MFQGRYKAILVDRDGYFLELARYIVDQLHGRYPPNYNEGHHLITGNGTTRYQVVP